MPQTGGLSHVSGRLEEPGNISLSQGRDGRLPAFLTAGGSGHPDSAGERLGLNTACSVYLWGRTAGNDDVPFGRVEAWSRTGCVRLSAKFPVFSTTLDATAGIRPEFSRAILDIMSCHTRPH